MMEQKRNENKLLIALEVGCWRMYNTIMSSQSCISHTLPNIYLDKSSAISSTFFLYFYVYNLEDDHKYNCFTSRTIKPDSGISTSTSRSYQSETNLVARSIQVLNTWLKIVKSWTACILEFLLQKYKGREKEVISQNRKS